MTEKFYPVAEKMIKNAETRLGISFPSELVSFYKLFGYGFLPSQCENINRIMDPLSIADYIEQKSEYKAYPGVKSFSFDSTKLPFFEVELGLIFCIEINDDLQQHIYFENTVIADSLAEFLEKYMNDEHYYIEIVKNNTK